MADISNWPRWAAIAQKLVRFSNIPEPEYQGNPGIPPEGAATLEDAKIVGSKVAGTNRHIIALDIDMPAVLVPSSTPGHFHLYIDHELSWDRYENLLVALAKAGVIEEGYFDVSMRRGETHLRTPWTRKHDGKHRAT
jgi:hypothetical protein